MSGGREEAAKLGRYAVFGPLASGGMGTVCFGRLSGPGGFSRIVAIKRLRAEYAGDPRFVEALAEEARLTARIRHANVVATLDVEAGGGELALVMEYVAGESLSRLVRTSPIAGKVVPVSIAAAIVVGVLHGLQAAHEARGDRGELLGLVHRDVSPENILVGADGVARIADFGIAKALGRLQGTHPGHARGKLPYMAPEQVLLAETTARTDVYAAGAVLWELLTGRRLITGEKPSELVQRILEGGFAPPGRHAADVPAALDRAVGRALELDARLRFDGARAFAIAIEEAVSLATPRQLAAFVAENAAEALARRAREVAAIEGRPREPDGRADTVELHPSELHPSELHTVVGEVPRASATGVVAATTVPAPAAPEVPAVRPGVRGLALVAALASAGLAALTWGFATRADLEVHPLAARAPADARLAARETSTSSAAGGQPRRPAVEDPGDPRSPVRTSSPSEERARRLEPRGSAPAGGLRSRSRARTKDCDPAYRVGADGIRRIKPECL